MTTAQSPARAAGTPGAPEDAGSVAVAILETVPGVMRAIRTQMRGGREDAITVPQFRALLYVRRHPSTSLSGISEHLGQTPAAASELVERLVRAGLLTRRPNEHLRRRVCVDLTPAGSSVVEATERGTREWLRDLVAGLDDERRRRLVRALGDLRQLIGDGREEAAESSARSPGPADPAGRSALPDRPARLSASGTDRPGERRRPTGARPRWRPRRLG